MSKAKQSGANKFFKDKGDSAQKFAKKAASGKSGLPSAPTAKGKNAFKAKEQPKVFSNDKNVMNGGGFTKFVC